ncbi:MAG: ATP-dependent metallopeptidase FtsH/Yme1/Tma family protein [Ignavibacteriales bacterium]|nr:ATP-dependent metallopeptidase FtsH/Yme1/Tma family protein [Ignavibacteriales bacterium]
MQFLNAGRGDALEVDYNIYENLLKEDKIKEVTVIKSEINNYVIEAKFYNTESIEIGKNTLSADKVSTVVIEKIIEQQQVIWKEKNIKYTFALESNEWFTVLISFLPWVLMIGIWILIMRRMQGGGGTGGTRGIFNFGKSRAKLSSQSSIKVTFKDVAGADEAKQELEEIIEFLKEPTKFQKLGGKIPRGVLLLGPPGTGKTLMARAVAGEAGVPFYSISGADFVEMFVGVGASRVRDLFDQGKKNAPCIIFIDEIDAVGRHRGAGLGGGHDEREQTLNALLVEMDGFEQNSGVIIIAATNRPDVLDPALLRPGRFDRQVVVDRPDVKGREGILKVHTRKIPLAPEVDLKVLAKATPGLAGAELANMVNEAALLAARQNKKVVSMDDFEDAKDKVMMGMERKSMIISEKEKKTTAYHEIGHVLVALKIPESDPVHKVTIIPRGRALGVTTYLPVDEKHTYSKTYLEATIAYALGGRAAEKIVFNSFTTGAGNDIEKATNLARKMVCEWGMSEKLGPLAYGKNEEELFLGREVTKHNEYSEKTAQEIDDEIKGIVFRGMERAEQILSENIDILHKLSEELLEREILDADEISKIINGEELPPARRNGGNIDESDEVPDHVKKLIEDKENRSSDKTNSDTGNDSN